jgi:2'-5' RNA ligase
MRVFLAVFPSAAAQAAAAAVIERLRRPGDGIAWVKRENLHYTVSFLGELGEDGVARAEAAAREGARGHRRFTAALGDAGAFPEARRARVIWLGLAEGGEALTSLARSVEQALRTEKFDRDGRPFTPHLTLGRARAGDRDWSGSLAGVSAQAGASFTVDRVVVVQSTLAPRGSRYQVRAEAALDS